MAIIAGGGVGKVLKSYQKPFPISFYILIVKLFDDQSIHHGWIHVVELLLARY